MEVEWKKINRWPYAVSPFAQVMDLRTGRILKPSINVGMGGQRYLRVTLRKRRRDGYVERKHYYLHRLVALYHVPGRTKEKCQVDHLRGNPWILENNYAAVLEWVTPLENCLRRCREIPDVEEVPF